MLQFVVWFFFVIPIESYIDSYKNTNLTKAAKSGHTKLASLKPVGCIPKVKIDEHKTKCRPANQLWLKISSFYWCR